MWNFNFGVDEMALSAEIGLYFDFEVTEDPGWYTLWMSWNGTV